jgi:membrane protease YdiL (CAAX protease family)
MNVYESSFAGTSLINMFYTLIVVGGTMAVFGVFFKRHAQAQTKEYGGINVYEFTTKFSAPKNKLQALLLIFISFGGCMLANYISSILLTILESFGLYSTYNSIQDPKTISDLIVFCLSVAVMPALIEEFAVRGILMSHLRRYGNGFAIITSSIFFGVFHGDAAQIPFAFICGLFFAYTVIATDSLWPGIIIHAMNNSLSCISSVLMQVADEETANMFFYVVSIAGIVLGGVCLLLYRKLFNNDGVLKFRGDAIELTTGQKVAKFLTSPLMLIAMLLYFLQSLLTLTTQQMK